MSLSKPLHHAHDPRLAPCVRVQSASPPGACDAARRAPHRLELTHEGGDDAIQARRRQERLDLLTESLYGLLQDLLHLRHGSDRPIIHEDIRRELTDLVRSASFDWLQDAVTRLDELDELVRRNIQKQIALEALAVGLRGAYRPGMRPGTASRT